LPGPTKDTGANYKFKRNVTDFTNTLFPILSMAFGPFGGLKSDAVEKGVTENPTGFVTFAL